MYVYLVTAAGYRETWPTGEGRPEATKNPTTGSKLYIDGTTITVTGTHDYERRGCRYYCIDGINSLGQEVSKIYRTVWL